MTRPTRASSRQWRACSSTTFGGGPGAIGRSAAWPGLVLALLLLAGCLAPPDLPPPPTGEAAPTPVRPTTRPPLPTTIATRPSPPAANPDPATQLPTAPPGVVTAIVDLAAAPWPISPLIYGLANAEPSLRPGLARWGGNPTSRYNWELGNAFNAAADWEFRNTNYGATSPADRAPSGGADQAIAAAQRGGMAFLLTIPALGWVARDDQESSASTRVPERGGPPSGPASDGGAGRHGAIAGYDPSANRARTSLRSQARKGAPFRFPPDLADGVVYQDEWVAHLVQRFGTAAAGGVRFYAIDNEPDLWSQTHRDVHPVQLGYDDLLAVFLEYATAIKAVDPTAQITGPVSWGWTGYFYSARDQGSDNYRTAADRREHGGLPLLAWFLQQVRAHDEQTGQRTLDVLDVHWYPQGGEYSGATDADTAARRLRATRQLWDPTYRDESWVSRTGDAGSSGAVQLIPRLRAWIDQYYPGTKLGITEWNYGADDTLNGALAIADVLGIFGRYGVDLAAYWRAPKAGSPGALAFRLYRDYDGQGGAFGDLALPVRQSDGGRGMIGLYASRHSRTNDLLFILVNRDPNAAHPVAVTLAGGAAPTGPAHLYRYDAANLAAITRQADLPITQGQVSVTLPPSSLTLLRLPAP